MNGRPTGRRPMGMTSARTIDRGTTPQRRRDGRGLRSRGVGARVRRGGTAGRQRDPARTGERGGRLDGPTAERAGDLRDAGARPRRADPRAGRWLRGPDLGRPGAACGRRAGTGADRCDRTERRVRLRQGGGGRGADRGRLRRAPEPALRHPLVRRAPYRTGTARPSASRTRRRRPRSRTPRRGWCRPGSNSRTPPCGRRSRA